MDTSESLDIEHIRALGVIAKSHLYENDKRVANAIHEAFDVLNGGLSASPQNVGVLIGQFERVFGFECVDAFNELMIACYNTAQYDRAIEVCDLMELRGLVSITDLQKERAELLGHQGNIAASEKILREVLDADPNNVWNYINLGDLYYVWQVLPENQDLSRAESWYYKALDQGLGNSADGAELAERLGDVCVERLRRKSEKQLLQLLEEEHMGHYQSLYELKSNVRVGGVNSVVLQHIQNLILHKVKSEEHVEQALDVLMGAYNLMPQDYLHGLCPFQMKEYYSDGEHSARILKDKMDAYIAAVEKREVPDLLGAEGSERFSHFQIEFMQGLDPVTGKQREKVVNAEYKRTKKQIESGNFVWMGFVKYRHVSDLSQVGNMFGDPFMQ